MALRVAINGLGRIGRTFFRMVAERDDIEVVAINDLGDLENLAYLLKYDTVYGRSTFDVEMVTTGFLINGKTIPVLSERDPSKLPWGEMNVDVVVESTGVFETYEKAKMHLTAGARHVVISAPAKGDPNAAGVQGGTILMGVNETMMQGCTITSNASCTTNAASPLMAILHEGIGIERAILNTVHAYTATQSLQDGPGGKDFRRGRAAAQNIVPNSTGAALALAEAYPSLVGRFDGIALRVPVPVGSIVDITFDASRPTTVEEVNEVMKKAALSPKWKDLFAVTEEQLVSSDIVGTTHASIADLNFTRVVDGTLVKVLGWYDNETSYTATLVSHVVKAGNQTK
ncbi:type I glyceraldehyde-3-phosphate dehydrogenase [Patescibacteria group bacterium]|nr:type I glyceraldehyde-3-phosphate dehydrogenase [Patescibacteria group bacterium]